MQMFTSQHIYVLSSVIGVLFVLMHGTHTTPMESHECAIPFVWCVYRLMCWCVEGCGQSGHGLLCCLTRR